MQGGIFIFPSIHYVLSVYKRKSLLGNIDYILSPIKGLNKVLGRGFPKGRCTGFIGSRGGHKSHLGYVQVLSTIIDNPNRKNRKKPEGKGIVVSLRDDEGTTHQAMQSILDQHWPKKRLKLTDLLDQDRLEIMYYPPGYITPEEFFHRMLLSIHRMKRGKSEVHITLLFNSLDQLSSRFPLCSSEHIFVPGIIQMLSAEEVTSIFVAAREPSQYQPEYHGLESLAELLLSFEQKEIPKEEYCKSLYELLPDKKAQVDAIEQSMPNIINAIITRVARFAGGQAAGAEGILELVSKEDLLYRLEGNEGLYCIPRTKK
jgi:hypothetical protein